MNTDFIRRVCAGLLAEQSERSDVAQLAPLRTSGEVQHPFLSSGLPCPFHICCHENMPRCRISS